MAFHPLAGQSKRLSAYIGEGEIYDGQPLYRALVDQARIQGCAGATVFRGIEGFGASSREVAKHAFRMSTDCPVVVSVIDEAPRISALAEVWSTMVPAGLVTVENVSVIAYCALGERPDE
jgi:PII-like signaling protein